MDVNALLSTDGDIAQLQGTLVNVQVTLQKAAYDYAKAALGAADAALQSVQANSPCGAVWPHLAEYQQLQEKANGALRASLQATVLLLNSEETGDDTVDKQNADAKSDMLEVHVVSAMLEGALTRANLAAKGLPEGGGKAGQRANGKAIFKRVQKDGG